MVRLVKTEKTFRKDFIQLLSAKLNSKKYLLFDELTIKTSDEKKSSIKIPDIVIVDKNKIIEKEKEIFAPLQSVIAVVETKHPSRDVQQGVLQAIKYMSLVKCNLCFSINFKEVIAINIVDNQTKVDEKKFGKNVLDDTISKTADYVADVISGSTKLLEIAKNDQLIIRILEGAVREIFEFSKNISTQKLEEPLGLFFTKKLDASIIKNPTALKDLEFATKKAASYVVVNQIVFYHILAHETQAYSELTEISDLGELKERFDQVLDDDYTPIFGLKVVSLLPKNSIDAINRIITTIQYLRIDQIKHDILGKIFHGLIPIVLRKRIAAYFTSNAAGELLAWLSIDKNDAIILDPACGSGTLLVSAYQRMRFLSKTQKDQAKLHKLLLKQIYGIDVALFAAHLAAINLALQQPLSYTDEVQITLSDALKVNPNSLVYYFGGTETLRKVSTDTVVETEYRIPKVDLVIMNPPFTRVHRMQESYRKFLEKSLATKIGRGGELLGLHGKGGKQLGLHGYFILQADYFLKSESKMSTVLPASTVYTSSGKVIRSFLLKFYTIDYIITSDAQTTFSEQSDFKEILLIASKKQQTSYTTKFVTLKTPLTLKNCRRIADKIKSIKYDYVDHDFRIRIIEKRRLLQEENWMRFTEPAVISEVLKKIEKEAGKNLKLGKIVIGNCIKRGFELYGAEFFFIPNNTWDLEIDGDKSVLLKNKNTEQKIRISKKYLKKALRSPDLYWNLISPVVTHYVLSIPPVLREELPKDLQDYLKWGENKNFPAVAKGGFWHSFIFHQIEKKDFFGNVMLMRKFLPKNEGSFCSLF